MLEMEEGKTVFELSISLIVGLTTPGTMKMKGRINNEAIVVLVNCGATILSCLKS